MTTDQIIELTAIHALALKATRHLHSATSTLSEERATQLAENALACISEAKDRLVRLLGGDHE